MFQFLTTKLRRPIRLTTWLIFLTLPLYICPLFLGTILGLYFPLWRGMHVTDHNSIFIDDMEETVSDWRVGGNALSCRKAMDTRNDFHLVRVNTKDWLHKLGFVHPREYTDPENDSNPIDKLADLQTLMRDTSCRTLADSPREQWLYLSESASLGLGTWDTAFNGVLEYVHAHSILNQSGIHFASCHGTAAFLCGVWFSKGPALLHFKVEDDPPSPQDLQEGLTYSAPLIHLRPITVRVIEFPLKDEYTGLPISTFPRPKQQMLSTVAGDRLYEQFDPYNLDTQMFKRFFEHVHNKLYNAPGTVLHRMNKVDQWMTDRVTDPLGIEPVLQSLGSFAFTISVLGSDLFLFAKLTIFNMIDNFLADRILEMPPWLGLTTIKILRNILGGL